MIEPDGLGNAYLDAMGLHRIYGPDEQLCRSIAQTVEQTTSYIIHLVGKIVKWQ